MIFADTSAFFSLSYPQDPNHASAKAIIERIMEAGDPLVTHNYILVESYSLMHRRLGIATARQFYKDVHQMGRVLWVSQSQHERASKAYVGQEGSRYSFVDCVSFEIMKSHGIKRYFAFDDDFKRSGFEAA
jgi:predicted nucleic acid-binding protein